MADSFNPLIVNVPGAAMPFAGRVPSQTWEQVASPSDPRQWVWAWFKPPTSPQSVVIRIPDEAWQSTTAPTALTVRQLAFAAGVDPGLVAMWQLYGMSYHGMNGANPLLDQPIPAPAPGTPAEVIVFVNMPMLMPAQPPMTMPPMMPAAMNFMPTMTASAAPMSGALSEVFDRLDIEWTAIIEVEKDLERLRKMLVDLSSRMKILNRDLSSDERLYSSREDKQDWQDARRMLRDAENRLRQCVKEFDIGDPSSAGYRRALEQTYLQFVQPRIPFNGAESTLSQFEAHRKLVSTLQGKMNTAYLGAVQNGERRAQQVLARIAGKVREAGTKKTALGVMMDG